MKSKVIIFRQLILLCFQFNQKYNIFSLNTIYLSYKISYRFWLIFSDHQADYKNKTDNLSTV